MVAAYLRSAFTPGDASWTDACKALNDGAGEIGRVEIKPGAASRHPLQG